MRDDEVINFLYEKIDSKNYGLEKCRTWLKSKCYEDLGNGDVYENNDLIAYLVYFKSDILEDLSALLGELAYIGAFKISLLEDNKKNYKIFEKNS